MTFIHPDKLERVRAVLARTHASALWLQQRANIAWLTDGARPYIHTACDGGVMSLVVTPAQCYALTQDIERDRLIQEEGMGAWQFHTAPWYAKPPTPWELPDVAADAVIACDACDVRDRAQPKTVSITSEIAACRAPLTAAECQRYGALGDDASRALFEVAQRLEPGLTEHAIAGRVSAALRSIGALPVVLLVACDDRITQVRHPLPTERRAERSVMLVVCAERTGLVVSLTRMLAFGSAPASLLDAVHTAAHIEAAAIHATRANAPLTAVWDALMAAYAHTGHTDAWRGLHQGGACSYAPRDYFITPDSRGMIHLHQAFAWNPSVVGGKSEDTLLVTVDGPQILTAGPWPTIAVIIDGVVYRRPTVFVVKR